MSDQPAEFETRDLSGTSASFAGTVGTSITPVPAVAGNTIQEFNVICSLTQAYSNRLEIYLDGGTLSVATLAPGGHFSGPLKGGKTQIHIKGNVASVSYQIELNREI